MQYTTAELERRMDRVRVLLDTHDDIYDDLSRCETAAAQSGFAEPVTRTLRCGSCGGDGCEKCTRGRVTVEERDPYDTGIGAFDPVARDRQDDAKRVERVLERIRENELLRAGVIAHVDFETMLIRADNRDHRGSYRELRASLDLMPRTLRGDAAVRWLALHLPRVIQVPRWAYERENDELREEVDQLRKEGLNVAEIAELLGLGRRRVRTLLREARKA